MTDDKDISEFIKTRRALVSVKSLEYIDDNWYGEEKINSLIDFVCKELESDAYLSDKKMIDRASKILMQIAKSDPISVMGTRKKFMDTHDGDNTSIFFDETVIFKWFEDGKIAQDTFLNLLYVHNSTGVGRVDVSNYIHIIELMKKRMGYEELNEFIPKLMDRFSIGWNNFHFLEDAKERDAFKKLLPEIRNNMLTEYPPELSKQSIRLMKYLTTSIVVCKEVSLDRFIRILEKYTDDGKLEHAKYAMASIDNIIRGMREINDIQLGTIIKTEQAVRSNIKKVMSDEDKITYYRYYRNYTSVILHSIDYVRDIEFKKSIKADVVEKIFMIDEAHLSKRSFKDGRVICRDEVLANTVKCLRKISTDPEIKPNDISLSYLTDVISGKYQTSSSELRISVENDSLVAIHNYCLHKDVEKRSVKAEINKMIEIQDRV